MNEHLSKMTAARAMYFMERFKHEEKLLGPNEQAAVDFVIAMLESQQEPVRIYDYVWPQREEHKEECIYACNYTPGHHLARGELLAVVHPSQLSNSYLQRDGDEAKDRKPVGTVRELFTQAAWERLDLRGSTEVYVASPQHTWVGLTDEEYKVLRDGVVKQGKPLSWMAEQIEANLREKNA